MQMALARIVASGVGDVPSGGGNQPVSGSGYWFFWGCVGVPYPVNHLGLRVHQGSAGAGFVTGEIGVYTTPLGPDGGNKTLAKLGADTLGNTDGAGPFFITNTSGALGLIIPPYTPAWIGFRIVAGTMPAVSSNVLTHAGYLQSIVAPGALTGAGPFVASVVSAGFAFSVDLMVD